jgi:hypothetical protein
MKRAYPVAVICLIVGVAWFLFFGPAPTLKPPPQTELLGASIPSSPLTKVTPQPTVSPISPGPITAPSPASPGMPSPVAPNLAAKAGQPAVEATVVADDLAPETVLQNVRRAIHQYSEMFGGDPVGTNPEITAALSGKNPKQIDFLSPQPGSRINDQGELVDPWGTPYFFHQLSATEMEVHSAGPDKQMWTSDDLVTK